MKNAHTALHPREGFTLVEVVVAIVLLATVLVSLGGLSYHAARQAINVGNGAGRQAVALELVNIMTSMPYDSIPKPVNWCDTVQAGGSLDRYRRCLTVTTPADRRVTVTVAVTPLRTGSFAQSYQFVRAATVSSSPLMMP